MTNHQDTCCEKCRNGAGEYALAIATEYCLNKECPCHTKQSVDAVERILDNLDTITSPMEGMFPASRKAIRIWLEAELTQLTTDTTAEAVRANALMDATEILHKYIMGTSNLTAINLMEKAQKEILEALTPHDSNKQ
jgi:hypothetical protein